MAVLAYKNISGLGSLDLEKSFFQHISEFQQDWAEGCVAFI